MYLFGIGVEEGVISQYLWLLKPTHSILVRQHYDTSRHDIVEQERVHDMLSKISNH